MANIVFGFTRDELEEFLNTKNIGGHKAKSLMGMMVSAPNGLRRYMLKNDYAYDAFVKTLEKGVYGFELRVLLRTTVA